MDRKNKTAKDKSLSKGIVLISLLAVVIVVVSIITSSYSWFSPKTVKATGIDYSASVGFRSENCELTHFVGAKNTTDHPGEITYTEAVNSSQTISANTTGYFKTNVKNNSQSYPTVVSLYISKLPADGSAGTALGFGVSYPSNSYREYTSQQSDFYIIRNAYIEKNDGTNSDAELVVEWFVKAGNTAVTIDLDNIYLLYN